MTIKRDQGGIGNFLLQNGLSLATVLCGTGVLAFDQLSELSPSTFAKATLALLCLLATSEIVDKSRRLRTIEDRICDGFDDLSRRLGRDDVIKFGSSEDAHSYITHEITKTSRCIHHAAIGPGLEQLRPEYKERQYAAAGAKLRDSAITYKYITAFFDLERVDRVQRWIEDADIRRFYVAHYPPDRLMPTIYFMVFDDTKVVARFPRPAGEVDEYVLITDRTLIEFFLEYHRFLWQRAEVIKGGVEHDVTLLAAIRQSVIDRSSTDGA